MGSVYNSSVIQINNLISNFSINNSQTITGYVSSKDPTQTGLLIGFISNITLNA